MEYIFTFNVRMGDQSFQVKLKSTSLELAKASMRMLLNPEMGYFFNPVAID